MSKLTPDLQVIAVHHVQLAMPAGGEAQARAFYCDILGVPERPKPESLKSNGGCWFEQGSVRIHLGIEDDFRPARKAHPALQVSQLNPLRDKLENAGYAIAEADKIDGLSRFFVDDPFGNRVEIIAMERLD